MLQEEWEIGIGGDGRRAGPRCLRAQTQERSIAVFARPTLCR